MYKIILDLEFCKLPKIYKDMITHCQNEIIQIGAVKLDENNAIIDEFNEYVKPMYSFVDKKIENLTHITNDMLSDKDVYSVVMNRFLEWIDDEDAVVYSWGKEDKIVIEREGNMKKYNDARLDKIFENWRDLQEIVDSMLCVSQNLSLNNVLKGINVNFIGQQHSAVDDARNTAFIYQTIQDRALFEKKMKPLVELMQPTESLTFSMGNLLQEFSF
ncbi:3'-5' exonuclease [Lachnobacterium bovis]|uniref:Inhibitor of the KinA pathway to sporulation, predicted exonuclease n=1 Tax=Lachnobacterium bovis TaxID=140626 RepID=A0A1H9UV21_9FIRM|nr:3'-5' exonuclease [Lachnobacterium bovis]SES12907.1 Inhibitor of the KinA pathway to sporulation, predicted exonuclease [Lachnobacterium bovis]